MSIKLTRWMARAGALLTFMTLAAALATPAGAHQELESSKPENGATLDHLPTRLTMTFGEPTTLGDLKVRSGKSVLPVRKSSTSDSAVIVDLRDVTPARTVKLAWKVVDSHDGHTSKGVLTFHVAAEKSAAPADGTGPPADPSSLTALSAAAHTVGYLAMAVLAGGLFFLVALWPEGAHEPRTRLLLVGAVLAGILAAIVALAVEIHRAGITPHSEVLIADYGRVATAMLLLWVLASVVVAAVLQVGPTILHSLPWQAGAVVVVLGIFRTKGMTAHATQSDTPVLGALADLVHLGGISAWIGGLVIMSIALLPRRQLAELEHIVPRFSKVAMVSVLAVATSGVIMLYEIGIPMQGFWTSHYSRILLLKLVLVATVMGAAMASKRWVDRSLAHAVALHRSTAVRSFAASVGAETVLVIGVLGVASVLVTSSPGT